MRYSEGFKAEAEDIVIEQEGEAPLILSSQKNSNIAAMKSIFGILPQTTTLEDVKEARTAKYR